MYKSVKSHAFQAILPITMLFIVFRIFFWKGLLSTMILVMVDTGISLCAGFVFYFLIEQKLRIHAIGKWLIALIIIFIFFWIMKFGHFFSYLFTGVLSKDFLKEFNTAQFQLVDNLLILIIGFLSTYSFFKFLESQYLLSENQALKQQNVSFEVSQLKQEFYPHYLMDSINLVYFSINLNNTVGRSMLTSYTDLLRYQFDGMQKERTSFFNEMEFIEKFLNLYSTRARDRYIVISDLNIPDRDFLIPPLLFIPFIENAFKHGGNLNQEKCMIDISLQLKEEKIKFNIKNTKGLTGHGLNYNEKGGIYNTRKRLELIYDQQFKLEVVNEEFVYRLSLTLPHKVPEIGL